MAGEALDVFISYSHRDEGLKDELVNYHLKLLQREGKINTWQDRDIEAGAEWAAEIRTKLETADIVLLLITRHFLASDYCYETEMQRAVQRHDEGTARVIPIILETCSWMYSDFKHLQVLPKDGRPVTSWDNQADAFFDVEEGIRRVIESLHAQRQAAAAARAAEEKRQREQAEAQRLEQERLAEEQRQREQAEAQRQEQERIEQERQEQERLAAEKRERERAEAQRAQQERQQQASQRTAPASLPLKTFEFEVVTLNRQGQEQTRTRKQAEYFSEVLGNGTWLDMVVIPGGSFGMGSPEGEGADDEKPQHQVTIPPFCMGKFTVTQAQWGAVAAMPKVERELTSDPSRFKGANKPVEKVSWNDAVEFCERLSRHTNRHYRLPSEAEWEYACRAGTTTRYAVGDSITGEYVNCNCQKTVVVSEGFLGIGRKEEKRGIYRRETTEVGSFPANTFGLYDMHGNVWEWCQDVWHNSYDGAPADGSVWVDGGNQDRRILRGGSWRSNPEGCRSAYRGRDAPGGIYVSVGFRVVCGVART